MNEEGLYKCYGRIQGEYPIFVLRKSKSAKNINLRGSHSDHPWGSDINHGQSKIKVLGSDIKAVSEKSFKNILRM